MKSACGTGATRLFEASIRKLNKLAEFRRAAAHCNDADVPLFPGREREHALDTVASELNKLESRYAQSVRSISVIMSLDVEYDVGQNRRLLVYRESEASY
jgi:hypothetical protein